MDELVARIASQAGVSEDQARKAIGILLNYLHKAAPRDKMQQLLDAIPGAADMLSGRQGGGILGGMMGAMAAFGELNALGLSSGQVQQTARETVQYAREKAGDEVVDDIVAAIPGVRQYL